MKNVYMYTCIINISRSETPVVMPGFWFQVLGCFTMFPLLVKDGLRTPYFACITLYVVVVLLKIDLGSVATINTQGKSFIGECIFVFAYVHVYGYGNNK